jgi:hypothetical protein
MGSRRAIGSSVGVAIAAFGLSLMVASCGESKSKCSSAQTAYRFIGTVLERGGNHADFVVNSIRPISSTPPPGMPLLTAGQHVKVHFDWDLDGSTAQFLHVGSRYDATLWWQNDEFWSDIHTADRPCSGGTVHADGSSINTSLWARSRVREVVYVFTPVAVALFATPCVRSVQRRRRRARRARLTGGMSSHMSA